MKRAIISGLERACCLTHPIVWHRPWLWLPVPVCPLAVLSYRLDEHWGAGHWKAPA